MTVVAWIVGSVVMVLALIAAPSQASAQRPSPETFQVEWKKRTDPWVRPGIEGWVVNPSNFRVGSMSLKLQTLDGSNQVVAERRVWVYGHVPAGGRSSFVIPLSRNDEATYRIVVDAFDLISQEGP
jgi:hypothetical protein